MHILCEQYEGGESVSASSLDPDLVPGDGRGQVSQSVPSLLLWKQQLQLSQSLTSFSL